MEPPNGKRAFRLLVFTSSRPFGLDRLWSYLPGKILGNGTSASPWKFPFRIWRVPFTTTVDQPVFPFNAGKQRVSEDRKNWYHSPPGLDSRLDASLKIMLEWTPWKTAVTSIGIDVVYVKNTPLLSDTKYNILHISMVVQAPLKK